MDHLNTILVGVDFSKPSLAAYHHAVRFAEANQATLYVIHVVESLALDGLAQALSTKVDDLQEEACRFLIGKMDDLDPENKEKRDIHTIVRIGNPLQEIFEVANEVSPDLVALGATGSDATNDLVGTLATKCLRRIPTKVLLVADKEAQAFQKIVACVDFSETSRQVADQTARIAGSEGVEIHFLHVFYPPWRKLDYLADAEIPLDEGEGSDELISILQTRLDEFTDERRGQFGDSKVIKKLLLSENVGQGIIDYSEEIGADLIVLSNRGMSDLKYFFLGSTAERVFRSPPCSVLALKPKEFGAGLGFQLKAAAGGG